MPARLVRSEYKARARVRRHLQHVNGDLCLTDVGQLRSGQKQRRGRERPVAKGWKTGSNKGALYGVIQPRYWTRGQLPQDGRMQQVQAWQQITTVD